jgi:ribose/xylose/arabinose/galactoside ABC-type transport system permease subunit
MEAASTTVDGNQRGVIRAALDWVTRYPMLVVLVLMAIASEIVYPGFFSWGNLQNLASQNAAVGVVAVGMTLVIIAGGFDLSVGAGAAMGAVFYADQSGNMALPLALLLTLLVGAGFGAINAFFISRVGVNSFITTLATTSVFTGIALIYSNSDTVIADAANFDFLGAGDIAGIPVPLIVLVAAFVIGELVLKLSVFGHKLFAVGGNPEAARLAGLRVDLLKASTFIIIGVLATFAGAMLASRVGIGQATFGATIPLDAIAVVIIGGTSLFGGEGSVWRTAVGLAILAIVDNLFNRMALDESAQLVAKGLIVLFAVAVETRFRRT